MIKYKFCLCSLTKLLFLATGLTSFLWCNNSYASPLKFELAQSFQDTVGLQGSNKKNLKVGMAQFFHDTGSFEKNRDKILSMMDQANNNGCELVVFDELALNDPNKTVSKAQFDEAISSIKTKAAKTGMFVVCGVVYRESDNPVKYHQRALVVNSSGVQESFYRKYDEIPKLFYVKDIACHTLICSDRWSLEIADLFCLVQDSQIIVDISGGHGGDDGRPELRWIRYRPWAQRTNAFVIVANAPHTSTDFMGNSPWGGHSAIFNPDGSFVAQAAFQNDTLIVTTINAGNASRSMSIERRNNPAFKPFWDMGQSILEGKEVKAEPFTEFQSPVTTVKVAAVQMVCSRTISKNIDKMSQYIKEAAQNKADLVIFPELAVTGSIPEDIKKVTQAGLNAALKSIQQKAKENKITVLFGMPFLEGNEDLKNSAWVVGPDGTLLTRYDQISSSNKSIFISGQTAKTMWFKVKGAYATVSIAEDAEYPEMTILAAVKGTQMHFHIVNENSLTADAALIQKQKYLNLLAPANFGTIVNAAKTQPNYASSSSLASGGSMVGIKTGGHDKSDPGGVENYFPYTASILLSAEDKEEVFYSTYTTSQFNRHERGRNNKRKNSRPEWYEWIEKGVEIISPE